MKIIKGSVDLSNLALTELPQWLADCHIVGYFSCSGNYLTSLKNAPKSVTDFCYCHNNSLISLEGAPKIVGRGFWCYENQREFTEEEEVSAVCFVGGQIFT